MIPVPPAAPVAAVLAVAVLVTTVLMAVVLVGKVLVDPVIVKITMTKVMKILQRHKLCILSKWIVMCIFLSKQILLAICEPKSILNKRQNCKFI